MPKRWGKERLKDFFYRMAKSRGYRSRAAFKLIEMNEKFKLFKEGSVVVDLGAYPGGWSQVALNVVGERGLVVAVDVRDIKSLGVPNLVVLKGDICDEEVHGEVLRTLPRKADAVISDAAPKLSGVWSTDLARQALLIECSLRLAHKALRVGGNMVVKAFQGEGLDDVLRLLRKSFSVVKLYRPKASKKASREIYIVCLNFKGIEA